jgi:hypothetical protein
VIVDPFVGVDHVKYIYSPEYGGVVKLLVVE